MFFLDLIKNICRLNWNEVDPEQFYADMMEDASEMYTACNYSLNC